MKYLVGVLLIVIIFLTGTVAYLVGKQGSPLPAPSPFPTATPIACTMEAQLCPDGSTVGRTGPNCEFTACPALSPKPLQTIKGGGILSFPKYSLQAGSDWVFSREVQGQDNEKITLTNGVYQLSLTQGGFGGSACLYPGDPDQEGPSGRYSSFVELTTKSGDKLRRSTPQTGSGFGICQLTQYGWESPTLYGHISLKVPATPTPQMLQEVDNILSSLTKL